MSQLSLVAARRPEVSGLVDLRCCDIAALLDELEEEPALVIADPPWGAYTQQPGRAHPVRQKIEGTAKKGAGSGGGSLGYWCLSYADIGAHVQRAGEVAAPGARLLWWYTWPLADEIAAAGLPGGRWRYKTGGAWAKVDHHGPGFHWAGCSEPAHVYVVPGAPYTDTSVPLRNLGLSKPGAHSAKPIDWQADMVRKWVPPGGLVLDLYAGLGSVARAVLRAGKGRRYVGAEVDPERHAAALSLIAQERG